MMSITWDISLKCQAPRSPRATATPAHSRNSRIIALWRNWSSKLTLNSESAAVSLRASVLRLGDRVTSCWLIHSLFLQCDLWTLQQGCQSWPQIVSDSPKSDNMTQFVANSDITVAELSRKVWCHILSALLIVVKPTLVNYRLSVIGSSITQKEISASI